MFSKYKSILSVFLLILIFVLASSCTSASKENLDNTKERYRVVVSTDIGGTDPDDFQSMAHLLLYADILDIEGLISSAFGQGRKEQILQVIDEYEKDYPNLIKHSDKYPTPDALRSITKQGEKERAGYKGYAESTEGSEWIIKCAKKDDPRPLYLLVWGGIEDVAQALHDAPEIKEKLRVYWIGGPNKKWSADAYQYIADNHPDLWIIESNATYRGWFNGGDQSEDWSNDGFPAKYIAGKGALGEFFMTQLGGTIKMGDTPSLAWLLKGDPTDPTKPSWGGQYVRAWERPYYLLDKMPSEKDSIEEFGVMELALPVGDLPENPEAFLKVDNQALEGTFLADNTARFRFSPKSSKVFKFKIESNVGGLDGLEGKVTAFIPSPDLAEQPSEKFPNWWTDDPNPEKAVGDHIGAKTVSQWRVEFLTDFADRMKRCSSPTLTK